MEFSEPAALARSQAGSADAPRPRHHCGVVRFLIDECLTVDLVSVAGQFAPDSPLEGDGFGTIGPPCDGRHFKLSRNESSASRSLGSPAAAGRQSAAGWSVLVDGMA